MEGLSKKGPGPSIPEKQIEKLEVEAAWCAVRLQSPSILASGSGFVKDNFPKDSGVGDTWGVVQAVMQAMKSIDKASLTWHSPPARQPTPNRPRTSTSPSRGG